MMMHHTHTQGNEQNKKQSKRCHAAHPFQHTTHNTQHNQHWACMVAAHTPLVHNATQHRVLLLTMPPPLSCQHIHNNNHTTHPPLPCCKHTTTTTHGTLHACRCCATNTTNHVVVCTPPINTTNNPTQSCLVLSCVAPCHPIHSMLATHFSICSTINQTTSPPHQTTTTTMGCDASINTTPACVVPSIPCPSVCVTPSTTTNTNNNKHNGVDGATQQHNKPVVHLMCCIVAIHWLSTHHTKCTTRGCWGC